MSTNDRLEKIIDNIDNLYNFVKCGQKLEESDKFHLEWFYDSNPVSDGETALFDELMDYYNLIHNKEFTCAEIDKFLTPYDGDSMIAAQSILSKHRKK